MQFTMFETVMSALADEFPYPVRTHKTKFTLLICIISFLLGLPQCTQAGYYIMHLIDQNVGTYPTLFITLLEIVAVIYVYGPLKFSDNVKLMLGYKPNMYWMAMWMLVTPITIVMVLVFLSIHYTRLTLGSYVYPYWAEILGWILAAMSLICIPMWMIITFVQLCRNKGFLYSLCHPISTLIEMTSSHSEWGPASPQHRQLAGLPPLGRHSQSENNMTIQSSENSSPHNQTTRF